MDTSFESIGARYVVGFGDNTGRVAVVRAMYDGPDAAVAHGMPPEGEASFDLMDRVYLLVADADHDSPASKIWASAQHLHPPLFIRLPQ